MPAGFNSFTVKPAGDLEAKFTTLASGGLVASDRTDRLTIGRTGVSFSQGTDANQVAKRWERTITFAPSTPVDLDLTALTGGTGDTNFAAVKIVSIEITSATGALIVGPDASNGFNGPLSGTTPTLTITAGTGNGLCWVNPSAAGWATSGTVKVLQLDPGAAAVTAAVFIAGE